MSEAINNQAERVQALKHVIKQLYDGQDPEQVKKRLRESVKKTDAAEIIAMEQQLIAEGVTVDDLCSKSGLQLQLLHEFLVQRPERPALPSGHPADTFQRENAALRRAITDVRQALIMLRAASEEDDFAALLLRTRQAFNFLMDVEKHYKRKERALLPILERHGITSPLQLMTAKDDEIRLLLSRAVELFHQEVSAAEQRVEVASAIEQALDSMEEMIYREENIFLPVAHDTLTEEEWAEVWRLSSTYGWCLIQPGNEYKPPIPVKPKHDSNLELIELSAGRVTVDQLKAILATLPVDLTFVDADDRVAFYNEGTLRLFSRTQDILGRKVQFCHPVGSIELVDKILKEFRAGQRDVAEFWIHLQDKFAHIRFFAVRDEKKNYIGSLEFIQDIAPLRKLEGDRRLLDENPSYVTNTTYRTPVDS